MNKDIILSGTVGSKAFNLDTQDSDEDKAGIFIVPTTELISVGGTLTLTRTTKDPDTVYHELGKVCALALKCNPSILELLWLDNYDIMTAPAKSLLACRECFLSKHSIFTAYGGYARAQVYKYVSKTGRWSNEDSARKNAKHTVRLMIQATSMLETGSLEVRLTDQDRQRCIDISDIAISNPDDFHRWFGEAYDCFEAAYYKSSLPDEPMIESINIMLSFVRHKNYWGVNFGE